MLKLAISVLALVPLGCVGPVWAAPPLSFPALIRGSFVSGEGETRTVVPGSLCWSDVDGGYLYSTGAVTGLCTADEGFGVIDSGVTYIPKDSLRGGQLLLDGDVTFVVSDVDYGASWMPVRFTYYFFGAATWGFMGGFALWSTLPVFRAYRFLLGA